MSGQAEFAPFAAAVYRPDCGDRLALFDFVEALKASGVSVGGLLQRAEYGEDGTLSGLYAIDIAGGQRLAISRPRQRDDECGLDLSALLQTAGVIQRAIDDRVDLVVVEKFGEQEQAGKGLIDEILQTVAAGIPLLIAVPAAALPLWQERSAEMGGVIEFSQDAFESWWRRINRGD